jgi:ribonuclease E
MNPAPTEEAAAAEAPAYKPRKPGRAANDPRERRRRERELAAQRPAQGAKPEQAAPAAAEVSTPAAEPVVARQEAVPAEQPAPAPAQEDVQSHSQQ